jgi:hypothetical protein
MIPESSLGPAARNLDEGGPPLLRNTRDISIESLVIPSDTHDAIGTHASASLDAHAMTVAREIDSLIDQLMRLKERLVSDTTTMRNDINRHVATIRTAAEFASTISNALTKVD